MNKVQIEKIIRSSIHIIMLHPTTLLPVGVGTGCIINYQEEEILLTAAHVTEMHAATCIDRGLPDAGYTTPVYSVGAMYYLERFDMTKYDEQITKLMEIEELKRKDNYADGKELIDFGLIDLSFARLSQKADFIQRKLEFKDHVVKQSKKLVIDTDLRIRPDSVKEYGFFGRIKPLIIKGSVVGLETTDVFYGGLQFIRKVGNYYEFELPSTIQDHTDFKGTSGAPIMDENGNVVSLVTHGYTGAKYIYGIALADFKSGIDGMLATDKSDMSNATLPTKD